MARPSSTKPQKDDERQIICTNRKARHDYTIIETFESGIELRGTEVKSLRDAKAQLVDSYAMVEGGQLYLRTLTSRSTIPPATRTTSRRGRGGSSCTAPRSAGSKRGSMNRGSRWSRSRSTSAEAG